MSFHRFSMARVALVAWGLTIMVGATRTAGQQPAPGRSGSGATPVVNVATVVSRNLSREVTLPGDLVAFQDVEIRARVSGFVQSVEVDRGSVVKKGAELARLEAPEMIAQLGEATAKVQSAQSQRVEAEAKLSGDDATYQRLKTASATPGAVAGNDVDLAAKAVEADRARVEAAKQNEQAARDAAVAVRQLESYLQVRAPFEGVITERNVHAGTLTGPSAGPMLRLQQVSTLRLVVAVPEDAAGGASVGQSINFALTAYPGQTFTGKLARVSHAVDPKTRTMPIEIDVPNPAGTLAPGMFAQVSWTVQRTKPSLFVPATAIATTTERTFVVRVRNGQVEWVDVKRGATMNQLVEVFGGLAEGDQVAVRGTDELRNGTKVQAKASSR